MWKTMARPSKNAEAELERLESMAGVLSAIDDAWYVIDLRFRQAERRAHGQPYLLAVLSPVADEMKILQQDINCARELLATVLEAKQAERVRQNSGEMG